MTNEFLFMIEMLKCAIHNIPISVPQFDIDWDILKSEAEDHRVLPIIFRAVENLPPENRPSTKLLKNWKDTLLAQGVRVLKQEYFLKMLIKHFENAGLRVLLFKGLVIASLYPHRTDRSSVDVDMLVDEADLQKADEIIQGAGYKHFSEHSAANEQTYSNGWLNVELHTRLWEEDSGERYNHLMSLNIGSVTKAVKLEACGVEVWTMPPQDTLIYLFYHIVKHFFACGIGVRYICDIVLYIKRYQSEINWIKFWEDVRFLGYTGFVRSFLCLCEKYMGLEVTHISMQDLTEKECQNAENVLRDIMGSGHNGRKNIVRHKTGRILRIYYENERLRFPASNIEMIKRIFFPTREELSRRKTSNRVSGKLTPIAWIQNLMFLTGRWKETKGQRCSLRQRILCAKKRLSLLRDLNLIN